MSRIKLIRSRIPLTRELAWAASWDAGNDSMRKAGRKRWSRQDYNAVWQTFNRLWPKERDIRDCGPPLTQGA